MMAYIPFSVVILLYTLHYYYYTTSDQGIYHLECKCKPTLRIFLIRSFTGWFTFTCKEHMFDLHAISDHLDTSVNVKHPVKMRKAQKSVKLLLTSADAFSRLKNRRKI